MSRYSRQNARRSIIDTIVFRVASQIATILGYVALVRAMSESDFGVLNLFYAFIPVVGTVASLGLEHTLRRYQPEYIQSGKTGQAYWLYRFVSVTRFFTSVLVLLAVFLAWKWVTPVFGITAYRDAFLLFSVLLVLHFQNSMLQASLASHMLHRYSVSSLALLSLCKFIGYLIVIWLWTLTLEAAIVVEVIAYAIAWLFMAVAHWRHCRPAALQASDTPDATEKRRLMRYGLLNNFNESGSLALNSKVDNFYIAAFLSPVAVAVYSFYTRLNEMTRQLMPVRMFERVVTPMMFATRAEEADRRIPGQFTLLLNLNLVLHWPLFVMALCFHAELVQVVFDGKYIEYSWLLPLIAGLSISGVITTPVTMVAQYEEKAGIILASKIFAVFNIGALILLIPVWGLYGAALSTRGFDLFKNLFIWWNVRRRARWLNAGRALASALVIWGLCVAVCQAVKLLPGSSLAHLLYGTVVVGLFVLLHLRSAALTAEDRSVLASMAGSKATRVLKALRIT